MRSLRLAAVLLVALGLASGAGASSRVSSGTSLGAPQSLRGFLLRADEPSADTFPRTPSFAWKPVRGAVRYQFELSLSRSFATGALLWSSKTLSSPAVSLSISLPWISGTPYSVYARARGIAPNGSTGPWSEPFGFNMRWPNLPAPLTAVPGLLRWSSVEGATSYQVWLLDPNKIVTATTNVVDHREHYTFHQDATWSGTVHWRVRAVRALYGLDSGRGKNGLPITSYGPWSPVYTATNPAFEHGPLKLVSTISDSTSTAAKPAAHHLMPAFVFSGDTALDGSTAELFRVYVATDRDCVNVVFRGSIVGSPAYAPRFSGPLSLPQDALTLGAKRSQYLTDGGEGTTYTADGLHFAPNESMPADQTPITSGEDDSPALETPAGGAAPATPAGPAPGVATLATDGITLGPPIDLWDTDWPTGRYFWTVVPVAAVASEPLETSLSLGAADGASAVSVAAAAQLVRGDQLEIGVGANKETVSVIDVSGAIVTISPPLDNAHGAGEKVVRLGGSLQYRDKELPQDACQSGRVLSFGKTSEPALTRENGRTPFASGLSPDGKLASAKQARPAFYGAPLVSWLPALGASAYEIQWSRAKYPFKPAATPILTFGTSAVLPLAPGTWWYRVRGLNLSLPAGARAMGWSDPVALVVTKPTFTVVGGKNRR